MKAKAKLTAQSLLRQIRVYCPSLQSSALWVAQESDGIKVGDVFLFFMPVEEGLLESGELELELDCLALIYREDTGSLISYLLDEEAYEMSSIGGVLSSKSTNAAQSGLALCYLRANLLKPLSKEQLVSFASMENAYEKSGLRMTESLLDPLYFFLYSLKVQLDQTLRKQIISIRDFAIALWSSSDLKASTLMPNLAGYFDSGNSVDPHNLTLSNLAARRKSASLTESVATFSPIGSPNRASSSTRVDPFAASALVSNPFSVSASSALRTSSGDLFATFDDPFAVTASPEASSTALSTASTLPAAFPAPEAELLPSETPIALTQSAEQMPSGAPTVLIPNTNAVTESTDVATKETSEQISATLNSGTFESAAPSLEAASEQIETASREIYSATLLNIKDEHGVHAETAVAAISAVCVESLLQACHAAQSNTSQSSMDKINKAVASILAHLRQLLDELGVRHRDDWSAEIPTRHAPKRDPFKLAQELRPQLLINLAETVLNDEQLAYASCLALANLICDCQEVLPASVSVLIANNVMVEASKEAEKHRVH